MFLYKVNVVILHGDQLGIIITGMRKLPIDLKRFLSNFVNEMRMTYMKNTGRRLEEVEVVTHPSNTINSGLH